jgi:hypothetical protein
MDLTGAHGIHEHALAADDVEHRQVGAGLLRKPDGIPRGT